MRLSCPHCRSQVELAKPSPSQEVRCPSCAQSVRGIDVPARLAHYEIVRPLGSGGMGEVFLARDTRLGRQVALKILPPEYAQDPARLERFQREARVASGLNHPQVCTIHDMGNEGGRPFIVMEWVEGETLRAHLRKRPTLDEELAIGGQIAGALAAAHAAGVVHRDVKPGNVMVRADGYVKVVDFGLARSLPGSASDPTTEAADLTDPGTLVGTVRYMSPEQARGRSVGSESDVFSLGVVLYEMVTGQHPFQADSQAGVLQAILSHTPLSPDRLNPELPPPLAALIQQMLARDPTLRPPAADVASQLAAAAQPAPVRSRRAPTRAPERRTVGRQTERADLRRGFESVSNGQGLFLCVTGEPGIGKTTLVEEFLEDLAVRDQAFVVGRGRCSERLAGTEAYLPFLEALESLLQSDQGDAMARAMKTLAPHWYVQVAPQAADDASVARSLSEAGPASQQRLKRELGAFLREASRPHPLVLFIDDIHWADASTVDLLAYLGGRCEGLRSLLVLSYRPTDLALAKHPFGPVKLDLQARNRCREVALAFLTREDVERYLALEFPGHDLPEDFVALIHARTEGSPLFMADLLRYLRDREVLTQEHGRWSLVSTIPDLEGELPESVRSMIQREIEQLGEDDLRLLVAASVQGYEFDAAVVAEALSLDPADVEDRLDVLERVHTFVRMVHEQEFPDRTLTVRYRFVHVLYQNALYATLRPARRATLSGAVADALLRHHGEENAHVAAELALLFEGARDFQRAADFFLRAARNAVRLFANHEAVALARRGLEVLHALPPTTARDRQELAYLITLGPPLKDTQGWVAPEVEEIYLRANDLCERIGQTPDLFPARWGVWLYHSGYARMPKLHTLGEQLLTSARKLEDPSLMLQAHHAMTTTHAMAGEWSASLDHAAEAGGIYDLEEHREHAFLYGGHDPGTCCLGFAAQSLWMRGYPDQALERGREALALARELSHPASLALTHYTLGCIHLFRRDVAEAREQGEASQRIVAELGTPFLPSFVISWALARTGDGDAALAQLQTGIDGLAKVPRWWHAYFQALMAEVHGRGGRLQEALAALEDALRVVGDTGIGFYLPEMYRLQGEFLRASGPERAGEAEAAFRRAIAVARHQQARSLELRAVTSLARLRRVDGRQDEPRQMLADLYAGFTEGFDTPDLKEAKALLESLS